MHEIGDYLYCESKTLGRFRVVEAKGNRVYLEDHVGLRGHRDRPPRILLNRRKLEEQGWVENRALFRDHVLRFFVRPPQPTVRAVDPSVQRAMEVLEVSNTCTAGDVRSAYLRLVQKWHPDHGGDEKMFMDVERANDVLSDWLAQG